MVRGFQDLQVWQQPVVRERLGWYYLVANNLRPAKYLLCRRLPTRLDPETAPDAELWTEHDRLTQRFLALFPQIRAGGSELADLPLASPNYLDVKAALAQRMLRHCNFCRWNCRVDRRQGAKHGTCQLESESRVGSYFHHRGEELPVRGIHGSGTIFFTSCNMRCVFCQNGDISHDKLNGTPTSPALLALMMWQLRMEGCHNINLVGGEPTIHLHNIVEAIRLLRFQEPNSEELANVMQAKADSYVPSRLNWEHAYYAGEFNVPILWNSNFFMSPETMQLLRTLVDIWLPDFKFGSDKCAVFLAKTPWYWETVTRNLALVYEWGDDMLIRHLIMPNHVECCTKPVLEWIARHTPEALVNVMDQYHPDSFAATCERYAEIGGYPTAAEIRRSYHYARELGLCFESLSWEKSVHQLQL